MKIYQKIAKPCLSKHFAFNVNNAVSHVFKCIDLKNYPEPHCCTKVIQNMADF